MCSYCRNSFKGAVDNLGFVVRIYHFNSDADMRTQCKTQNKMETLQYSSHTHTHTHQHTHTHTHTLTQTNTHTYTDTYMHTCMVWSLAGLSDVKVHEVTS